MNKREIRQLVHTIRRDLNLRKLPIDLDDLAQKLNIKVIYESLKSEGYFINYNNKLYIFLNKDSINRARQRFTFAHEIGHRLLHKDSSILQRRDMTGNSFLIRELKSLEDEANYFAAELLCPTPFLEKNLPIDKSITMKFIEAVARKTDISIHAAAIKCIENSKTANEVLLFFDQYGEFSWFCSADTEYDYRDFPKSLDFIEDFLLGMYEKHNVEQKHVEEYGTLVLIAGNKIQKI